MNKLHRLRNALFAVIAVAVVPVVSACSSGASNEPLSLTATPPTTALDSTPTPQLESELGETPAVPVELQVLAAQEALLTGIYDRIVPSVVRIVNVAGHSRRQRGFRLRLGRPRAHRHQLSRGEGRRRDAGAVLQWRRVRRYRRRFRSGCRYRSHQDRRSSGKAHPHRTGR